MTPRPTTPAWLPSAAPRRCKWLLRRRAPDLIVASISAPASAQAGRSLNVSWTVTNQGTGRTPDNAWEDAVYLSPTLSTQLSAADILIGTYSDVSALAANGSYTNTQAMTIPANLSGTYYVVVFTDSTNVVQESAQGYDAEANNTAVSAAATLIAPATPPVSPPPPPISDLDVTAVTAPQTATAGQTVNLSWTVANNGPNATAATQWSDQVVISPNSSLDASPDSIVIGSFPHSGALSVGATYANSTSFTLPDTFSGTYYVFVTTNAGGGVYEDSNAVNTDSTSLSVTPLAPADLQVTTIQLPVGAQSGQNPTISWTVTNNGTGATPADESSWTDEVYVASPGTAAPGTLVGSYDHQGVLQPGGSYSQSAQISLAPFVSGTYTVTVVTDATNAVLGDSATDNHTTSNSFSVALAPVPDLAVGNVSPPATALAGQPVTVGWQVNNVGAGSTISTTWYDSVYLSLDQFLDPSTAVYLGTVAHSGDLDAGNSYTGSLTTVLPANLSGPYYVFVVTDSQHQVFENGATANNTGFSPTAMTVSLAPESDLEPIAVTVPTTGQPGQPASSAITWTVSNIGANTAIGQWSDSVYLSKDGTFDSSSQLIATVLHTGNLAPGTSYTASTNAALPGVAPGDYYLIVRTDVLNNVRESDENNNQLVSTSTISMASVPALSIGVPATSTIANGEDAYYAVTLQAGEELTVTSNFGASDAAQFYLRYGALPTQSQFDQVYGTAVDEKQELTVPTTQNGVYYVLVHGVSGAGAGTAYTIEAQTVSYGISSVSPAYGSNAGKTTVVVSGAQLNARDQISLQRSGGSLAASQQWWVNSSTVWATFDLAGLTPGQYDVVSTQDGNVSTLSGGFTVNTGPVGALQVHVLPPGTVKPESTNTVTVQYTNIGNTDIPAPLLEVTATNNALLQGVGQSGFSSDQVEVLGINNSGPAGILPPGVTGQITLNYQSPGSQGIFQVTATPISLPVAPTLIGGGDEVAVNTGTPTPIDWSFLTNDRPASIAPGAWTVIVNNFLARSEHRGPVISLRLI